MATGKPPYSKQTFIRLFDSIARHKHHYTVFSDFAVMAGIALHNAIPVCRSEALEKEYLAIAGRYSKAEMDSFSELLANLIVLIDTEPRDILGELCSELELGNLKNGQFFTPHEISVLIAKITFSGVLGQLEKKRFLRASDPACGAGGMILAFAGEMIHNKINPAEKLFVQCIDIDRVMAFMCYLQLSLWNIPAEVIVGNTLTMELREVYYTPAYYLWNWDFRLKIQKVMELFESTPEPKETEPAQSQTQSEAAAVEPNTNTQPPKTKIQPSTDGFQQADLFSFDFQIDH